MHAGVEVKVEDYDGSYVCLFCGDSVRGLPALVCGECNSNPWHRTCDKDLKYTEVCPTCNRQSVKAWTGAGSRTATPSEIINLTRRRGGRRCCGRGYVYPGRARGSGGCVARGRRWSGRGRYGVAGCTGGANGCRQWQRRQGQGACLGRGQPRGWERWCGDECGSWRGRWLGRQGQGARGQWVSKGGQGSHRRGRQRREGPGRPAGAVGWPMRQQGRGGAKRRGEQQAGGARGRRGGGQRRREARTKGDARPHSISPAAGEMLWGDADGRYANAR